MSPSPSTFPNPFLDVLASLTFLQPLSACPRPPPFCPTPSQVEAAERADKTEEDKQKLLRQLRELQTGPSGPPSSHPGTPAPPGSSSYYPYSAAAVPQAHAAQHPALLPPPQRVELGIHIEGSGATHGRARQPEDCEVLALNVSGREVWVQRSTLLHVRGSLLHEMFAPGSGSAPPRDCYGRPFL